MSQQESLTDDQQMELSQNAQILSQIQEAYSQDISDSRTNRLSQLSRMHQNLVSNSKKFISKLCFMLSKFIPFDQSIKQSLNFIKKIEQQWRNFSSQKDKKIVKSQRNQSYHPRRSEQMDKSKFQSFIIPIIKQLEEKKSQVSTQTKYSHYYQPIKKRWQTQSLESINGSLIDNVISDQQKEVKQCHSSEYKMKIRDEFFHVRQFIIYWLHPRLEVQKDNLLQKKTVLNCYIDWNRKIVRQIQIPQTSKIQTELTVQLKLRIPEAESIFRFFKGIGFKDQYMEQMNLSDCRPSRCKKQAELSVQQLEDMHPLEQIRILARSFQKNDKIIPYNEQKMYALDVALGLI